MRFIQNTAPYSNIFSQKTLKYCNIRKKVHKVMRYSNKDKKVALFSKPELIHHILYIRKAIYFAFSL